jgi:hypothetical protein
VILVALAAFSLLSLHLSRRAVAGGVNEQLKGFLYVGAAALLALAVAVVVVGLLGDQGARAEGLAMFGFFVYALYLATALLLHRFTHYR